jgi:arsenite methyltransferase
MTEKSDVTGLVRERYASAPLQLTGVSDTASASCCVPTHLGNGSILWRKL